MIVLTGKVVRVNPEKMEKTFEDGSTGEYVLCNVTVTTEGKYQGKALPCSFTTLNSVGKTKNVPTIDQEVGLYIRKGLDKDGKEIVSINVGSVPSMSRDELLDLFSDEFDGDAPETPKTPKQKVDDLA